ncbi:spheroidene monooxygenase [Tropicibacter sp. S64]|uniref:spheroidene monooxygenase n=1 Tax=Tropicibacter sp. S64 TaxID=3415122 RepID=UPI003C7DA1B2
MSAIQTVSLSFYRFARFRDRLWAFAMMGLARPALVRIPGLRFWKLCGSGTGEGFTPVPNTAVYAILAVWDSAEQARTVFARETLFRRYHARAAEAFTVFMTPISARGVWSGRSPFTPASPPETGPIAALTRATLRPRAALRFWRRVPGVSAVIGDNRDVAFKIGIGEVPWLHQVTFSIWPDADAMARFARVDGPHARAIRAVREGGWFREELYARFRVLGAEGTWHGTDPLSKMIGDQT